MVVQRWLWVIKRYSYYINSYKIFSLFYIATIAYRSEAVKLLVNENANLNVRDKLGGLTPIMRGEYILKIVQIINYLW